MKKMMSIFAILVVALGSVVSASALPMPDLTGCPNIEYENGNLVFDNVAFSSLDKEDLKPILDCFKSGNNQKAGFFAVNPNFDCKNPKSVLFEFYAFYTGGNIHNPHVPLKLVVSNSKLCIKSIYNGQFGRFKWSFWGDGSVNYEGYSIVNNISVDSLILSENFLFNLVSNPFTGNAKDFFIEADFKEFVIKDDLNINPSFKPIFEGPVRPPEAEKSIDYIPYDKDVYTSFVDCFFKSVLVIVPIGISLFVILFGTKLVPKVLKSFVW